MLLKKYFPLNVDLTNQAQKAKWLFDLVTELNAIVDAINNINVGTLPNYADNAEAIAAGLKTGQLYRNGDIVQVVH
jgi:hypothetical protein